MDMYKIKRAGLTTGAVLLSLYLIFLLLHVVLYAVLNYACPRRFFSARMCMAFSVRFFIISQVMA